MANLTITVDDRLLKQARMRALEDGTSVNALLRSYLERYAGVGDTGRSLSCWAFSRMSSRAGWARRLDASSPTDSLQPDPGMASPSSRLAASSARASTARRSTRSS